MNTLLRVTLVLLTLLIGLVGAVRFLPRPESPLQALIAPPADCPAPCWQGIRPDATHYREALSLLAGNPNIVALDARQSLYAESRQYIWYIYWTWDDHSAMPISGSLMIQGGIVRMIRIYKGIPFGLIWSMLGTPDEGLFVGTLTYRGGQPLALPLYHIALYRQSGVSLQTDANCARFWWEPSALTVGVVPKSDGQYNIRAYRHYACDGWQPGAT
jgi:hypothetical protein